MIRFFCFFALLASVNSFAQEVSISLSVKWENETIVFNGEKLQRIPYLNIQYRNNSNQPVFLKKISYNKMGLPQFPSAITIRYKEPKKTIKQNISAFRGDKYYVLMYNNHINFADLESVWLVVNDSVSQGEESTIDLINGYLALIYKSYRDKKKIKTQYGSSPVTMSEKDILDTYKDLFVFLDVEEMQTISYNLIGFYLLKGSYNFKIDTDRIEDFVYSNLYLDDTLKTLLYEKVYFPEKIGKYSLFSGEIGTSELEVIFD